MRYIDFINYMIKLEIGLEIRHGGVMRVCVIDGETVMWKVDNVEIEKITMKSETVCCLSPW